MSINWTWMRGLILGTASTLWLASSALTQSTPPQRLVIPFPAGGPVDSMARVFGEALSKQIGKPVIVENKPGADGAIGAIAVINAAQDGNTLLFATNTALLAPATLRSNPPYDPRTALTPISFVGNTDFFLYVHSSIPARTVDDLVAYAKKHPKQLAIRSPEFIKLDRYVAVNQGDGYRHGQSAVPRRCTGNRRSAFRANPRDVLFQHLAA